MLAKLRAPAPSLSATGPALVLGLDPGTRHFGWGLVARVGNRLVHVAHGTVHTDTRASVADRLVQIEADLAEVVRAHAPLHASIESLFFAKDAQAAAKLGHARGVALLVCARAGMSIAEYPPARVKRTVAGSGRAEKEQVAQMVRVILGLAVAPTSDAADALAVAVTHLQHAPLLHTVSAAASPCGQAPRAANPRKRSPAATPRTEVHASPRSSVEPYKAPQR